MIHKISVRVSSEVFRSLREESLKHGVKISDVVRDRLRPNNINVQPSPPPVSSEDFFRGETRETGITPTQFDRFPKLNSEMDFATIEVLYLLREFLFERNAQILKKVDEKMERRFGKERKRIV